MTKSKMTFVLGLAISMLMSTAVLAAEPATIAGGGTGGIGSDIATRAFNEGSTGNEAIQSTASPATIAGGGIGGVGSDVTARVFNANLTGTENTSPAMPETIAGGGTGGVGSDTCLRSFNLYHK
ncbi:hypothetical protein DW949_10175 [Megasphaera sp. AM44-1BH]|uniref:hypothetical protein n=1 Tax=Megasphaera sp. AM44-1BH TaxID=2292358 RepID=UPI000E51E010|nr:hypothetical protein [Megasphaera sp. AM44-1BH]RHA10654.1 hypothetical protein DW949_10175 [Megasphaera sp. AM44-1BH]